MIWGARKQYPAVSRASPGGQPPSLRHSARSSGPAARWIAPSTPPPPSSEVFAALTIASTRRREMSPEDKRMRAEISGKTVIVQRQQGVKNAKNGLAAPAMLPTDNPQRGNL